MKKLVAAIGIAAAAWGTSVTLCPSAAADPQCPSSQAEIAQASGPYYQRHIQGGQEGAQAELDWANFLVSCAQQGHPAAAISPDNQPELPPLPPVVNPQEAANAAINATGDPTVGQAPNCSEYAKKYDGIPDGVNAASDAAAVAGELPGAPGLPIPGPSDVLLTCGLANSVIAGVAAATGNFDAAAEAGRQATIGDCWAGQHAIPFLTLPGNCGG